MTTVAERRNAYKKKWAEENKERLTIKRKEWLLANPEKRKATVKRYKDTHKQNSIDYILNNYEWYIFNSIRSRARIHNLENNLELSDIIIPETCAYLGIPLTRIQGQGRQDTNPSVDRIDPTKGYIKGNIEIISDKANRMKNNATQEELILFATSVLRRYQDLG